MKRYLIIEDEPFACEELKRMMKILRPEYQLMGTAESIDDALFLLQKQKTDLVLVDIHLSDGLCFDLFEQCSIDIPLIFTTAYDEYALKAFKQNSIDYLLKPVDEKELEHALCKFERNTCSTVYSAAYQQLEASFRRMQKKNRFLVQMGDTYKPVTTEQIAFFYSEEKHVYLHLFSGQRYIVDYTLEQLEKRLDTTIFCRVSRNCIVHIRSVQKVTKYFLGRLKIHLQPVCPHEIFVSRSRVECFLSWLDGENEIL